VLQIHDGLVNLLLFWQVQSPLSCRTAEWPPVCGLHISSSDRQLSSSLNQNPITGLKVTSFSALWYDKAHCNPLSHWYTFFPHAAWILMKQCCLCLPDIFKAVSHDTCTSQHNVTLSTDDMLAKTGWCVHYNSVFHTGGICCWHQYGQLHFGSIASYFIIARVLNFN
jgi:hypothetical protein